MVEITHQKEYWEKARKRRHPTHPVIKAFTSPKIALLINKYMAAGMVYIPVVMAVFLIERLVK